MLQGALRSRDVDPVANAIRVWAEIISHCHIDLVSYGASERSKWLECLLARAGSFPGGSFYPGVWRQMVGITDFAYGASPAQWTVALTRQTTATLYRSLPCPGAWPTSPLVPDVICWHPSRQRSGDESWEPCRSLTLTTSFTAEDRSYLESPSEFDRLMEDAQDDSGVVVLMISDRPARRYDSQRISRSHSEPRFRPKLRTGTRERFRKATRPWLDYHPCEAYPHGSPYHWRHSYQVNGVDFDECARGTRRYANIQETPWWKMWSSRKDKKFRWVWQ